VTAYPHRFRHHFSHTWLDRGGAERDLMELNGWTSPPDAHPLRRQRPRRPRPPQLRPHHGRHHLTPATTRPAPPARAAGAPVARGTAGQPSRDTPGTDAGAPPPKTSPPPRTFIAHGRSYARQRQPREQGAAGCPAPVPDRDHRHHPGSTTAQGSIPACSADPPCRLHTARPVDALASNRARNDWSYAPMPC